MNEALMNIVEDGMVNGNLSEISIKLMRILKKEQSDNFI
jgi:hypothetical protein